MIYKTHEEAVAADPRYGDVKLLIDTGRIVVFDQVFSRIKKTIIAQTIGVKVDRFNSMLECPGLFRMNYIENMAILFGVKISKIVDLLYNKPVPKTVSNVKSHNLVCHE